jgi:hypothetical protein
LGLRLCTRLGGNFLPPALARSSLRSGSRTRVVFDDNLGNNLGNFMRTLALPKAAEPASPTSLRGKLINIGAKVISDGRY